jgi:hypothetical protein
MNSETTPTKSRTPLPPPPPSSRKKNLIKESSSSPLQPVPIMGTISPPVVPTRGGINGTYGFFLGGGAVELVWLMSKARYHFSTQIRDECSVSKVERELTDVRDKTTTLKFNGTLELEMKEGMEHELDKEQIVRKIDQLTHEHGHQSFYAIEQGGVIFDMFKDQHFFLLKM